MMPELLPPPVETILIYAAYGWAAANGFKARSGRPKLPERDVWLPLFAALAEHDTGKRELARYARLGLAAWNVPFSIAGCLGAAFADPRFDDLLPEVIRDLADTARTPVTLPTSGSRLLVAATGNKAPGNSAAPRPARTLPRRRSMVTDKHPKP